jgi:hypothetical protein
MAVRLAMTKTMRLVLMGLLLVALAACGGSDPDVSPAPAEPPAPPVELTIDEALEAPPDGLVTVTGYVIASEGQPVRLCSAILESYPPQCGEPSLVVEGLDLGNVPGITRPDDPQYAHTAWTDTQVPLTGEVADGTLAVKDGR